MRSLVTSVTALRFTSLPDSDSDIGDPVEVLLAGIGNQLHVFISTSESASAIAAVLPPGERVHGFSTTAGGQIIVHGGRYVVVVALSGSGVDNDASIQVLRSTKFDDWVWATRWVADARLVAVACGHSQVWICSRSDLSRRIVIRSSEKELTWSTTLFQSAAKKGLRAAAGTSFGDVLMWTVIDTANWEALHSNTGAAQKPDLDVVDSRNQRAVHRMGGHDGPVMKLKISADAHRMLSASVDRTVRVWQASKSGSCATCESDGCFVPVFTHYGHLARVWDVAFLEQEGLRVVSVGEDRTCRVWSDEGPSEELAVFHGHAGRNVWSLDVKVDKDAIARIATGGEDGSIKVRSFAIRSADHGDMGKRQNSSDMFASRHCVSSTYEIQDKYPNPRKAGGTNKEGGRSLLLLQSNLVMMSTDFGRILSARLTSSPTFTASASVEEVVDGDIEWSELYRDISGTAYTPSSLVECSRLIFAGQANGNVVVLRRSEDGGGGVKVEKVLDVAVFGEEKTMVMGLFAEGGHSADTCDLFAATGSGSLYHWSFAVDEQGNVTARYSGRYCQENPTKTALVTSVCLLSHLNIVVVGDRGGRVLSYGIESIKLGSTEEEGSRETCDVGPSLAYPTSMCRPHSDRVSSILKAITPQIAEVSTEDATGAEAFELIATSFDGRLSRIRILHTSSKDCTLNVVSTERTMGRVETIDKVLFPTLHASNTQIHTRQVLVGFRSAYVVVWDVQQSNELFRANCGNWRRAHGMFVELHCTGENGQLTCGQMTFAFWRAGRLHVIRAQGKAMEGEYVQTLGPGFHGLRVNAVSYVPGTDVVITASEDTFIGVHSASDWQDIQRLGRHVSAVNDVAVKCVNRRWVLVSGGGADEIVVWVADEPSGPWRDIGRVEVGGGGDARARQRVLCVALLGCHCGACINGIFGRSDGSIGIWYTCWRKQAIAGCEVDVTVGVLNRLHRGAVLCCAHENNVVASGDSRGRIVIWHVYGSCGQWQLAKQLTNEGVHDAGVNCIDIRAGGEANGVVVVSGGDDERVCVSFVGHGDDVKFVWKSPVGFHSAAVTGVCFAEEDVEDGWLIVSVGADQRVRAIRLSREGDVQMWACAMTNVPDPAAVQARIVVRDEVPSIRAVVVGCGVETVSIPEA